MIDLDYHPEPSSKFFHSVMPNKFEIEEHNLSNSFDAANGSIGILVVDVDEYLSPDEDLVYQREALKLYHCAKSRDFKNKNNAKCNSDASSGSTCLIKAPEICISNPSNKIQNGEEEYLVRDGRRVLFKAKYEY